MASKQFLLLSMFCKCSCYFASGADGGSAPCTGSEDGSCVAQVGSRSVSKRISSDHLLLQRRSGLDVHSSSAGGQGAAACCNKCSGKPYCSPVSGGCYRKKRRDYYESCPVKRCEGTDCPMGWVQAAGDTTAEGKWCEVEKPPATWNALRACPTGNATTLVKVMTYNLFWWNLFGQRQGEGGRAGRKIASTSTTEEYDLIGFQECDDVHRVMNDARSHGMKGSYGMINGGRALAMAYLKSRWTVLGSGREDVGEDSRRQYYGKRSAHWARLRHNDGATVFFINHHGPLPVSHGGGCTGSATAYNIMRVIAENAHAGDGIILVGDFNAQNHSSRIRTLDKYMHKVFTGSSHGGVDHIFSNCHGSAVVSAQNLGSGGSDHDALSAVLSIPRFGVLPSQSSGSQDLPASTTTTTSAMAEKEPLHPCCKKCSGKSYCSPVSWNCYDTLRKDYYATCAIIS
eukprot:TRINITY_DN12373_c0_g1_i1.p1 TRINITY_DN12373_c0_g1~~TRINITY_DN12373_c0_g1_i1.p1  ORF type:complete len:456 (-),score=45.98 TRINITY_DN12373_c0_g1_i1:271-1638(-)